MYVRTALLPELSGDVSEAVCIVIDVLRATTVIAVMFERGARRVYIAESHDIARQFARAHLHLLCGETDGLRVQDFDYGNSPMEYAGLDLRQRTTVLSTSNGTKATTRIAGAHRVYLGAMVNRSAVAEAAMRTARQSDRDIVVVCSGTNGRFTLEDAVAAGAYVEALTALGGPWTMPIPDDASVAARRLWQSDSSVVRSWMEGSHARDLGDKGFGDDIGLCAALDVLPHVPTLVREADADATPAPVLQAPAILT